jgi:hypothetical protein
LEPIENESSIENELLIEQGPSIDEEPPNVQHSPTGEHFPINAQRVLRSAHIDMTRGDDAVPLIAESETSLVPKDAEARAELEIIDLGSPSEEDSDIEMLEATQTDTTRKNGSVRLNAENNTELEHADAEARDRPLRLDTEEQGDGDSQHDPTWVDANDEDSRVPDGTADQDGPNRDASEAAGPLDADAAAGQNDPWWYSERWGYVSGPYNQHTNGPIRISQWHRGVCNHEYGTDRHCTVPFSQLTALRSHLRHVHDLDVSRGQALCPRETEYWQWNLLMSASNR